MSCARGRPCLLYYRAKLPNWETRHVRRGARAWHSPQDPAVPYEDCAPRRQLLERCSHAAIGLLLDVALMPPPARAAEPSPWPEADGE